MRQEKKDSNQNEINTYVEYRLRDWGYWFVKDFSNGLGYPKATIEWRIMTEGILTKSTGSKTLPSHADAEEIEKLVNELNEYNDDLGSAVRSKYIESLKQFRDFSDAEVESKLAAMRGISPRRFRDLIFLAKTWLAGRLGCKIKKGIKP
jgi:hypothetical protein